MAIIIILILILLLLLLFLHMAEILKPFLFERHGSALGNKGIFVFSCLFVLFCFVLFCLQARSYVCLDCRVHLDLSSSLVVVVVILIEGGLERLPKKSKKFFFWQQQQLLTDRRMGIQCRSKVCILDFFHLCNGEAKKLDQN